MALPDPDSTSVFDEIRKERSGQSVVKALALRVLGLAVIALAVWVIAQNVSWKDTLILQTDAGETVLEGTIEGDWRGDEVGFRVSQEGDASGDSAGAPAPFAALGLEETTSTALEETLGQGAGFRAREGLLLLPGGKPALLTEKAAVTLSASPNASKVEWRPGMVRTIAEIDVLRLLPALGFLILASLCVVTRWWRLLRLNDCPTRWYDAFRYTYSGLFFNAVVPGINGGDVARAVAVVRVHPDRRAEAFMTVVIDRVIGLIGMIVVGTVLVLGTDERLANLRLPVSLFCGGIILGAILYFNPLVRRLVRFDTIVPKLPQGERLQRLDLSARRLLSRPGEVIVALLFSFGNHVLNGLAVFAAAGALGSTLGFHDWMTTMAISNTLAAVPISPGGLGVGEVLFGSLAEKLGSTYALGVATSLVYRLCLYAMSLLGGLVMLLPAGRPAGRPSEPRVEIAEPE